MKKIINILIIILIFNITLSVNSKIHAETNIVDKIVEEFNKSDLVTKNFKLIGDSVKAVNNGNEISVEIITEGKLENIHFPINGNVITTEVDLDVSGFVNSYLTEYLINCIGKVNGYKSFELNRTLNDKTAQQYYSIENEGFKYTELSEGKIKMEFDITKRIPLLDFSNTYIESSDLKNEKEKLSGDNRFSSSVSKGNIFYDKKESEGNIELVLKEEFGLTQNTYKSIISVLKVMFNNDNVLNYFKANCNNLSEGNKEFDGFSIKINPEKTVYEEYLFEESGEYEFVRININRNLALSASSKYSDNIKIKRYYIASIIAIAIICFTIWILIKKKKKSA